MQDLQDNNREALESVVKPIVAAIPVIGSVLCSIYSDIQQEKRFHRVETLYEYINEDIDSINTMIIDLEQRTDKASLKALHEEINANAERDVLIDKLQYFKNCFFNTLTSNNEETFYDRKYFINTLNQLTAVEIEVLINLYKADRNSGYRGVECKQNIHNFKKLESLGFMDSRISGTLNSKVTWAEISLFSITEYGVSFVEFCLQNEADKLVL